jgi:hypothetical protein
MKAMVIGHGSEKNRMGGGVTIFLFFELAEIRERRHDS